MISTRGTGSRQGIPSGPTLLFNDRATVNGFEVGSAGFLVDAQPPALQRAIWKTRDGVRHFRVGRPNVMTVQSRETNA